MFVLDPKHPATSAACCKHFAFPILNLNQQMNGLFLAYQKLKESLPFVNKRSPLSLPISLASLLRPIIFQKRFPHRSVLYRSLPQAAHRLD